MSKPPTPSPYAPDLVEVRAWLEKMIAALQFVLLVTTVMALITRMRDLNTELTKRLAYLSRKRPRSETLARVERQLLLPLLGGVDAATKAPPAKKAESDKPKRSRLGRHPGRAALPAYLERVPVITAVAPERRICPECGCEMATLGYSVREALELRPACLVVIEHKSEHLACANDDHIVSAIAPPDLVPRGKLGHTLIVEALCDKYIEHQPIERQCLRYERAGVDIAPQTLGRSVAVAIDLLAPVSALICEQTRAPGLLGTDATSIPILDRDAPDGIRTGTMWAWTNARWVTFFYSPVGDSDSARRFLGEDFCRTVQCDGTSILTFLERAGGKRPGCWSHGRRGLVEAARGGDLLALEGVHLIQPLFVVEKKASFHGDTAERRKARRLEYSAHFGKIDHPFRVARSLFHRHGSVCLWACPFIDRFFFLPLSDRGPSGRSDCCL